MRRTAHEILHETNNAAARYPIHAHETRETAYEGSTVRSFWAELAWLPSGLARGGVRMTVSDGRFVTVETRTPAQPDDLKLCGVVMPGLANAHSHAFQRSLRGRTHSGIGHGHAWFARMYAAADRMDPDRYFTLARATFAEMAIAGYTLVGEFHYLHHGPGGRPYDDPNAMGAALIAAAAEAGIRLTLLDACYLAGGLTSNGHIDLNPVQRRFSDGSVDAWLERMTRIPQTELMRRGAAIHSIKTVPREAAAHMAQAIGEQPLHVYVSEQHSENLACQMFYGMTPTELLADIGALGPEVTAVHAAHLSDNDIALLGDHESQVVVCPSSERDMGESLGRIRTMLDAGIPIGVGSDQQARIDPFSELRELELNERVTTGERGRLTAAELVACGTVNGYQSLGWYDGGVIAPGRLADFVVINSNTPRTVGAKAAELLYAATAADIDTVVVGGRVIVTGGQHHLGPVAPMLRSALLGLRGH
ncbi:MAG: formimidoylglutamate deiminase [Dermatophilaceae bacterium]|nr:formimidoylglutamate deiminase [Dermatophilaceae bacterium]